jgi:hypothetical protein
MWFVPRDNLRLVTPEGWQRVSFQQTQDQASFLQRAAFTPTAKAPIRKAIEWRR